MIRISPIFLMLLVVILSACGNLEWPPKSTGIGYLGHEIGLVNSARNTHKSPLTLSPQKKAKNFLESRIGDNSREHIVANGETLWRIAQVHNTDIYELAIL
nr:LysM peptidoglycan-binding domain-containing protein [Rhodospirillales bacterium]